MKSPTLSDFLSQTFLPLLERKWKTSTFDSNFDRIQREIGGNLGNRLMASLDREDLQAFLDSRSALSFSTASHLRWDLKQIFDVALSEGIVTKNPALMLFVPKNCKKTIRLTMTLADVRLAIHGLDLRERIVFKLATVAGLRPGEIFGLRRRNALTGILDIQERVYRGEVDTPKTDRGVRSVALAETLREDLELWLAETSGEWLFQSERGTPLSKDNFMARHLRPALEKIGLGHVSFQVMRRTHASLMRDLGIDPKLVADSMGHDIATNLSVYTTTSMESRLRAAETLGSALVN